MILPAGLALAAAMACNAPFLGRPAPTAAPSPPPPTLVPSPSPEPTPHPTPTVPAPTGKIVYTCQIFGESTLNQICMMNADGSNQVRLTTNDQADHLYPSLAPDGSSLVFTSNQTGDYEIYEQTLDGTTRQLTTRGDAYAPAISPDGSLIVFTVSDGERQSLWIMNRDGSGARLLVNEAWDAAWSPDGGRILHASDRTDEVQLFIVDLDGMNLQQVTETTGLRGRSDWSPDGRHLATYLGTPWNREIYVFIEGEPGMRQITNGGNNLAPSFSPDGNWISFTSYMDRYQDEEGCEIYIMRIEGSDIRRLTDNEYCDWQPRWGP